MTVADITRLVDEFVTVPAWGRKPRTFPVRFILLHATRGAPAGGPDIASNQYRATINWFTNPGTIEATKRRLQGWQSMADFVVGSAGQIAQFGDFVSTRSNWSAGYGDNSRTQWGADELSVSIELAQTYRKEPMTDACLQEAAKLVAELCHHFEVPVRHVPYWDQEKSTLTRDLRGLISHDGCANGRKLDKSDPGWSAAEWDDFVHRVEEMRPLPPMTIPRHVHPIIPTSPLRTGEPEPPDD